MVELRQLYQLNPMYHIEEKDNGLMKETLLTHEDGSPSYQLNETAHFIVRLFLKPQDLEHAELICRAMYQVTPEQMHEDLVRFIEVYYEEGILMKVADAGE